MHLYLDNNATTPVDKSVLEKALPFLSEQYANASSRHVFAQKVVEAVENARKEVADLLNAEENEIFFTSGATESINLVLKGIAQTHAQKGNHIITLQTEHSAVLDTCRYLESIGLEISYLPVQKNGLLDLEVLKKEIQKNTILICVMLANNETGVLQDLEKISQIAQQNDILLFTDATQALGKIEVDVKKIGVDLLAFSGHKFYAPKGIGGIYKKTKLPNKIQLMPLLHGGGHEKGLRSGTLNTFGIVALGQACRLAKMEMTENQSHTKKLRDLLETELLKIPDTFLNGDDEKRLPNTSNICFVGVESEALMLGLPDIAVSNGSACTSMKIEPSHVLTAMGLDDEQAFQSIRFSVGKTNTEIEIRKAIIEVKKVVESLRELS